MAIFPKLIYRFNIMPIKILAFFSIAEVDKLILKFICNCKVSQIAETILKKKNKIGGLTLPDFKTYYKATAIKTVWYQHKDKLINQWDRIKSTEINSYIYSHLIFNKGVKTFQGERIVFSTNGMGQPDNHV
uniref:Uncharacterized protein n=1 Tax=Rousettus aegyptiacus TaxID=9407 RepID=A0A7J8CIA5_ROUAE|nr:hypothetical protein HJG63_009085 [Rousettus aegyptiacus]